MIKGIIDATSDEYVFDRICDSEDYSEDKEYSIDDCVLVRTTDVFPQGHTILSPKNGFGVIKTLPEELRNYIYFNKDINLTYEEKKKLEEQLSIYELIGRDTIHFCINGLVGDHAFNSFGGRPYTIIEPLKYHIEDKNLETLRVEDTFFSDRVNLSDEAVLIINEEFYNSIKDDPNYVSELESYNIYLYKGDNQSLAVAEVLNELGYDSFSVNSHGYVNGLKSTEKAHDMYDFINNYAVANNISIRPHFGSSFHYEENARMNKILDEIVKKIFYIIARDLNKNEDVMNELDSYFNEYKDKEFIKGIIDEYGLDRLIVLVSKVNEAVMKSIQESKILGEEYKGIKL